MRHRWIGVFALVVVAVGAANSSAEAQVVRGVYGPRVFAGAGGPVTLTPGYGYNDNSAYVAPASSTFGVAPAYVPPYSYYAVPVTVPARIYIGPNIYPFYGRPYGNPYDRWTWPYISGGPNADLARYYYPPLG